ncbi:unnamed protein product [Meganyctiphanes norvegica]|uniref:NADH dehydrogenase subunit 4L n=1 Tax=Meganyctiphanes norvegica TaxID=48144 RepID=A0AAV2R1X6_MEGNR
MPLTPLTVLWRRRGCRSIIFFLGSGLVSCMEVICLAMAVALSIDRAPSCLIFCLNFVFSFSLGELLFCGLLLKTILGLYFWVSRSERDLLECLVSLASSGSFGE